MFRLVNNLFFGCILYNMFFFFSGSLLIKLYFVNKIMILIKSIIYLGEINFYFIRKIFMYVLYFCENFGKYFNVLFGDLVFVIGESVIFFVL